MGQGYVSSTTGLMCWGFGLVILNTLCFEGLLTVHEQLAHPFGKDPIDFDREKMMVRGLRRI